MTKKTGIKLTKLIKYYTLINHNLILNNKTINRYKKNANFLVSNKNDALGVVGRPHSKSIENDDKWIYLERILTKGKYHKLGQHVLKSNNVLVLTFDKFGVLKTKSFYDKDDVKKVKFSEKITENKLSKKSFVETFLSSVKEKMYSGRK